MIFGLLYFCVVILCVNRSRSSFILYRLVKRHSRQSNVRRIWTCADNGGLSNVRTCIFTLFLCTPVLPIVGHGPADTLCVSASGSKRPRAMAVIVVILYICDGSDECFEPRHTFAPGKPETTQLLILHNTLNLF